MPRLSGALTHVALLRGINVGGRNRLPMSDLVRMFSDTGCHRVRTYIQSGNVVFEAAPDLAARIPELIATSIHDRFGFLVPVIVRTAEQLCQVVESNPFLAPSADKRALHVAFLADRPDPAKVATLDPDRSPPDELAIQGREIYLRLPNGVARTKLTNAYLDSRLGTTSTMRNWRTTCRLLELATN